NAVFGQQVSSNIVRLENNFFRSALAKELHIGQQEQVFRLDSLLWIGASLDRVNKRVGFLAGGVWQSFLDHRYVHISNYASHFVDVFRLSRAVGFVFEAERNRSLSAVFVADHSQPA